MSAMDMGLGVVDAAEAPVTDSSAVDTSTVDTTDVTTDNTDSSTQVDGVDNTESTEGQETETHKADGTERTPEERAQWTADQQSKNANPTPQSIRQALKSLKESNPDNPAISKAVKELHGSFERWNATKTLIGGNGSPNILKDFLGEVGVPTLVEAREAFANTAIFREAVAASDALLYGADKTLCQNVLDDMKSANAEANYPKVVGNFLDHLKNVNEAGYYEQMKPHLLSAYDAVGLADVTNQLWNALNANDTEVAKGLVKSIARHYNELRNETSETAKISKERQAWESEKSEAAKSESAKATVAWENSVATEADQYNNTALGKEFATYLRQPFFKDFPRESKIALGNQIKANLYATLKADKAYQAQMTSLWKVGNNPVNNKKIQDYHKSRLDSVAKAVVDKTIAQYYPAWAKGGSAAGRVAAVAQKKEMNAKISAQSVTSGKPVYVASKPANLVREPITVAGREFSAEDLRTLLVAGKGYVKTGDGKGYRYISWRK